MSETNNGTIHPASVSMDIELGQRLKPGEVINFDFEQFYKTAKDMGATDEEISGVHIDVVDPKYRPGVAGSFHPPSERLPAISEVVFNKRRPLNRMSNTLVHEFQHYLDHDRSVPEAMRPVLRYSELGKVGLIAALRSLPMNHPREKRARKAQNQHGKVNILTVDKG